MNKFLSLVKIEIKDFLGKTISGLNLKNKSLAKLLILLLPIAISMPIYNLSLTMFISFAQIGSGELVITMTYIGAVMLMFFLGIPFIVSIFFYSRDIQFLAALPFKEREIVFAKLSTVYLYLLLIAVIIMGPALIVYGGNMAFSIFYIIKSIFILLLTPLLPMLISAVFVMLMSSILIKSNYKNLFTILSNFILIAAIIALQLVANRYVSNPEYIREIILSGEGLLNVLGMRFPPSIWLTKIFLNSFKDSFYFLALNIALLFILAFLSKLFYRKAILTLAQGAQASGDISFKKQGKKIQLIKRHLLIIIKEPTFLMNTIFTLFIPLILFVVMSVSGDISKELLNSPQMAAYNPLIFILIIISPVVVSNISATVITREGKTFWQTKVLPISHKENIKSRVMISLLLSFLAAILMGIFALYLLNITLKSIFISYLFAISAILFFTIVDIIINIYRPFLNWTNATAAVKNNLNVMIALAIRAIVAGIIYIIYNLSGDFFLENLNLVIMIATAIFFAFYLFLRHLLYTKFIEKFKKIWI
ncbi:MAG: putative ABC transporter permease subunit [Bacillota bacterium]